MVLLLIIKSLNYSVLLSQEAISEKGLKKLLMLRMLSRAAAAGCAGGGWG